MSSENKKVELDNLPNKPKIKEIKENQPEIKENQPEINVNDEISKVLKVSDTESSGSDLSDIEIIKPKKTKKTKKFVPGGLKTRTDLIRKIQQAARVIGNEAEVKQMRLHRRRRASLDGILREQIALAVSQEAEKRMGIPPESDTKGRLEYAVSCLYSFDLCVCKLVEKIVDYYRSLR